VRASLKILRTAALAFAVVACLGVVAPSVAASARGICGTAQGEPATYRHVVWIWMENHSYDAIVGSKQARSTNRLAAACGLATNYHNVAHPSLPNYIAATSGGTQGIRDDCQPSECSRPVQSIFGQLQAAGMTWAAYQESMSSACDLNGGSGSNPSGEYAPKHDPAVYYLPLRADCRRHVVPLGTPTDGALARALATRSLPRFSFVTPNLCNDTHDCPVATGDAWLARWVMKIVSSPVYRAERTVIFVTWDEGEGGNTSDCAVNTSDPGCHIATLVVSPTTRPGTRSAELFNHYALLRTTEQLLGIKQYLGHARQSRSMRTAFRL
jgi:phospholipase C